MANLEVGDYVKRYDGVIGRVNEIWDDGLHIIGYPDLPIEAELYPDDPRMPKKASNPDSTNLPADSQDRLSLPKGDRPEIKRP